LIQSVLTPSITLILSSIYPFILSSKPSLRRGQPPSPFVSDESDDSYLTLHSIDSKNETLPPPKLKQAEQSRTARFYDLGTRCQALTLYEAGVPVPTIVELTKISERQIYRLRKGAIAHGYDRMVSTIILIKYVEDAPRSDRGDKVSQVVVDLILSIVIKNSTTCTWSTACICQAVKDTPGFEKTKLCPRSVYNALAANGYGKWKQTVKPGLTLDQKMQRLQWCLAHEH